MSDKKDNASKGNVTNVVGPVTASAIGNANTISTGDITLYEQRLKQSGSAVPPELVSALVGALKDIQASGLSDAVKKEALADHAKLTDELKKPVAEREPTLLKKFWNGLWTVADKLPAVVTLYEVLKNHVPGIG